MPDLSWALQRKLMRAPSIGFNAEVYRWFKDLDDIPSVTRTALRNSLLIQANESRTSALFKLQYFREMVQKVHQRVNIIDTPKEEFNVGIEVKYKPVVRLYFQQDKAAISSNYAPVTAEISFRLMDESTETITQADIRALANQIRTEFATGAGYTFSKGKYIATYYDKEHGYHLQVYVFNEIQGVEVVRKVLSIRNHAYNEDYFRITEPKKSSVNSTSNLTVAGKTYKRPRWRPTATVRFQWANLILHSVPDPICLVDRTLSRYDPVVNIFA